MDHSRFNSALIVGAGSGLSASLARALAKDGIKSRFGAHHRRPRSARQETGARRSTCDASKRGEVEKTVRDLDATLGAPDIVVYNASFRTRGPFVDSIRSTWRRRSRDRLWRLPRRQEAAAAHAAERSTGRSCSPARPRGSGYPSRALAHGQVRAARPRQSMARELTPQGIHVAHVVIDGGIKSARAPRPQTIPTACSTPTPSLRATMHLIP